MTATVPHLANGNIEDSGAVLFLGRWLANPLRMGSVIPSSQALCGRIVRYGWPQTGGVVLDLGAGTGVISRAFLGAGLPPERLISVEIDRDLVGRLRRDLPGVTVIDGDARSLPDLLPGRVNGRVRSVICGIPLVLLPLEQQRRFIEAMRAAAPGWGFLHYSYCVTSPLPTRKHGLIGQRLAWTPLNFPPASVWRYMPA